MFKFDFGVDTDVNEKTLKTQLVWRSAEEVLTTPLCDVKKENIDILRVGSLDLKCIKPSYILSSMQQQPDHANNISLAENSHSDLIPSKYEGGLKVWECTHDIANNIDPSLINGKSVLDLGCGVGLLGILALKLGARNVTFQDYNKEVIEFATMPNVQLNADADQKSSCRFFSGDWESFARLASRTFDVVLTSETIYNPDNYIKLHDSILKLLNQDGTAIVAAKSYYFGVGGSTREFERLVKTKDLFHIEVAWRCERGVQREILKLRRKQRNSS